MSDFTLEMHGAIAGIDPADWDACAGSDNPFVSHAFLAAIEESGSTGRRTGWLPQHATLRDADGQIAAVAPLYAKLHSYGEYVFDHGWAHAYEQAGGRYYPKLQAAVPFSPVPGPRLLVRPTDDPGLIRRHLAAGIAQATEQLGLSSAHITFCTESEQQEVDADGWMPRLGVQFHWHNHGYGSFDDFLAALSSRKRKSIRRERRDAHASGLTYRTLRGTEIGPEDWAAFYGFYTSTVDRKWGSAYLTETFFPLIGQRLGDRVVLMVAEDRGTPVAAALNLLGGDTLYGRNWGCQGDWPFLHFELCYYRAIDFAIANGLARVEAGAQGEHKIQRGYLPVPTYSAHFIADPGLRRAIKHFVDRERVAMREEIADLATLSPYRKDGED